MIVLSVEFNQMGFEVCADLFENRLHIFQYRGGEDTAAIFCHEDQMGMKRKNTVSSTPIVIVIIHRLMLSFKDDPAQGQHLPALPGRGAEACAGPDRRSMSRGL